MKFISRPSALALSLALLLSGCGKEPGELLAQAKSEYAAHDYRAARSYIVEALKAEPANRDMLLLHARIMLAMGDGSGAGAVLEKLAAKGPRTSEMAELSGEAALLRGKPDAVEAYLAGVSSPEAERLRALAAMAQGDMKAAALHFDRATALGGNARAFADLARFRMMQGDEAGADEMLARAVKVAPGGIDTLLVGADFAARRGDLGTALERYGKARALFPGNVPALVGEAAVLGDLGRIPEMEQRIADMDKAGVTGLDATWLKARLARANGDWGKVRDIVQPVDADLPPGHPLRVVYAEALSRLGNAQQAIAKLQPLVQAQPANRAARMILAEAQIAAREPAAALSTIKPLADSPQARPDELALAARIAKSAGDPVAASRYAQRSTQPAPQVLGGDLAEADAAMRQGDWARAATAYDRILKATDGRNVLVLNNMAMAQLMLGNAARANEFAQKALKLAPQNASVMDTAGWVLYRTGGDRSEAVRLLRAAAQKAPANATISRHLAEAGK